MRYLSTNQVLVLYNEIVEETGGSKGLRDIGMLESAVARPRATFGGKDLYSDVFSKAAALGYSIIRNHAFVDGNKRIGYMAMEIFLRTNGYGLKATLDQKYTFVMEIAQKAKDEKVITQWLKSHSKRMKKPG